MVSRTTVMTLSVALSLAIAGCSAPAEEAAPEPTSAAEQTPTSTAAPEEGPESAPAEEDPGETPADLGDLPDFIQPYPKATVVSSSRGQATAAADSAKLEQISLVMKAEAAPNDIAKFYSKAFEKADFETYGDEVKTKEAQVLNFRHKKNEGLLVVTISTDPDDKANSIITIGGTIVP